MNVKEAVSVAKKWLIDVMADEQIMNVGLEEVEFHEQSGLWTVTLGFSRPWNSTKNALLAITGEQTTRRAYRSLTIDDSNGKVIAMKRSEAGVF